MKGTADSLKPNAEKSVWVTAIDLLIGLLVVITLAYTYIWNPVSGLKLIVAFILMACVAAFMLKKHRFSANPEALASPAAISKLALLNEDGQRVKEWFIQGETSLLIGKSASDNEADIDLSEAEYASLISKQHAVLNFASGVWYLEDLDSRNGVGLKKQGAGGPKQVLENETPHKVESGDIIYIANTRLLVK
ncbi:FHA domain-containing protein [Paenibacillus rigui]|uniref:FHA domain-containing protein n=1 Tax=Paenibacillus rigui TaxID=554312 RepID=A0A229UPP5_9BACL|nr:FHA domain-containing protein [Paenibacillus rigui]OXM85388.1 hypothetical protein CF651_15340 [Paenibacillus rigui]